MVGVKISGSEPIRSRVGVRVRVRGLGLVCGVEKN